jgi:hypothetical protein
MRVQVPDSKEIEKSYAQLILCRQGKKDLTLKEWVKLSRMVRFDPRIGELWILAMQKQWKQIAPTLLNEVNLATDSAAILCVLLEQVEALLTTKVELKQYRLWKLLATFSTPLGASEQFFIGVRGFATDQIRTESEKSLKAYRKWGYLGSEMLVNKFKHQQTEKSRTYLDAKTRKQILKNLMKRKMHFTAEDYREECGDAISIRTAQLDLQNEAGLKTLGNTRDRIYFVTPAQPPAYSNSPVAVLKTPRQKRSVD